MKLRDLLLLLNELAEKHPDTLDYEIKTEGRSEFNDVERVQVDPQGECVDLLYSHDREWRGV